MKSLSNFLTLLGLLTLAALPCTAQDSGFGLGIIAGQPTGLSLKAWNDRTTAFDGALAWSFGKRDRIQIHGDYLWHDFDLIRVKKGKLPLYYGIGAAIAIRDDDYRGKDDDADIGLGIRIPVGLVYIFARAPFDIFVEIAPKLNLIPSTDLDINAALGGRFYF